MECLLLELENRRRHLRSKIESSKFFHGTINEYDFCTHYSSNAKTNTAGSSWAARIESDFKFNTSLSKTKTINERIDI